MSKIVEIKEALELGSMNYSYIEKFDIANGILDSVCEVINKLIESADDSSKKVSRDTIYAEQLVVFSATRMESSDQLLKTIKDKTEDIYNSIMQKFATLLAGSGAMNILVNSKIDKDSLNKIKDILDTRSNKLQALIVDLSINELELESKVDFSVVRDDSVLLNNAASYTKSCIIELIKEIFKSIIEFATKKNTVITPAQKATQQSIQKSSPDQQPAVAVQQTSPISINIKPTATQSPLININPAANNNNLVVFNELTDKAKKYITVNDIVKIPNDNTIKQQFSCILDNIATCIEQYDSAEGKKYPTQYTFANFQDVLNFGLVRINKKGNFFEEKDTANYKAILCLNGVLSYYDYSKMNTATA